MKFYNAYIGKYTIELHLLHGLFSIWHFINNPSEHYYTRENANCQSPCSLMEVFFGFPVKTGKTVQYPYHLRLYFKRNVLVRTSLLDYSFGSMMGELGGYFGLLLGFSLTDFGALLKEVLSSYYPPQ